MTRLKLYRIDFWIYIVVAFILGIFCAFCFSSPSSEARFQLESGFIDSTPRSRGAFDTGVGIRTRRPAPAFTVTAYCPCKKCCGKWSKVYPRKTASGHIIQLGDYFVAAPPEIPFGTKLSIPGYAGGSMVAVEDRGGKIKGNRLDVFFDSHSEALAWGVREMRFEQ